MYCGLQRFNILPIVFFKTVLLTKDIHKPGQPQYLVVITGQVIDYVEAKYKCTSSEEYWSLAAQRRMVYMSW
jgi:hypothetical protein